MKIKNIETYLLVILAVSWIAVSTAIGQQELLNLKVDLKQEHTWTDDSNRPPSDSGSFTIPGAGYARFTFSGSPLLDQHIFSYKLSFPGSASQLLPGTGVDSNQQTAKNVVGQPFVWWWTQKFTDADKGMKIECNLAPKSTYSSATHWVYPPQDLLMRVEWLGEDYNPPKGKGADIGGIWKHGDGGETWTFAPDEKGNFQAIETGFRNATGTAIVSANEVTIDYTSADGKVTGKYVITISEDGKSGVGKWSDSTGGSGERSFTKIGNVITIDSQPAGGQRTGGTETEPVSIPDSGMVLQIESKQIYQGEATTVAVWLHRAADLANMNVEITYLPDVVQTSSVSKGKFLPGGTVMESNVGDSGIIRIGFAGKTELNGTGPIAHVPFAAIGPAGSKSPLTLKVTTASSAANKEPVVQLVHGVIEIVSAVEPGDSNGNGILDSGDALDALKMSVKLIPENKAADIDKDGKVTSTDARLILEQVVKQTGAGQ